MTRKAWNVGKFNVDQGESYLVEFSAIMFNIDPKMLLLSIPPLLLAFTAHEWAHAIVAERRGDPTARLMGRVTFNPLKHLDPFGTASILLTGMFGWAKPVPVNPRNLRDPGRDLMLVSLAGPATNLTLAAASAVIYKVITEVSFFNSVPDGVFVPVYFMVVISLKMNVALAVFNMLPIHPLDGSKVLAHFLPPEKAMAFSRLEPYGFMILLTLIFTGALHKVMSPVIYFTVNFLTGGGA